MVYMRHKKSAQEDDRDRQMFVLPAWLNEMHRASTAEMASLMGRKMDYSELATVCLFWFQTLKGPKERLDTFKRVQTAMLDFLGNQLPDDPVDQNAARDVHEALSQKTGLHQPPVQSRKSGKSA